MEIEYKYQIQTNVLNKNRYSKPKYPIVPAIVKIPNTGITSYPAAEEFLIDTGASISILHHRNKKLFEEIEPIDSTTIIFGNSTVVMNVYNIILRMNGVDFEMVAALSNKLNFKYSLLGYYKGIETFDYLIMNNIRESFKLVNKN